jgi:hypothetical protein
MNNALSALRTRQFSRAGELLDSSFVALDAIVTSNHPNALSVVLKTIAACYRAGFAEVADEVSRYVYALAEVRLQERDPRWVLFRMIHELNIGGDSTASSPHTWQQLDLPPMPMQISPASTTKAQRKHGFRMAERSATSHRQSAALSSPRDTSTVTESKAFESGNSEVVSVYEVFCRDLWRHKKPGGGVLVLLWYPSLFCW